MARRHRAPPDAEQLLAIYLNDHLAGSSGGLSLIRRIAQNHRDTPLEASLSHLAREVAEDRASLREIMRVLGIPRRRARAVLGALAERAGRLKLNGRLVSRSPLSDVLEFEAMRLGVEAKGALWSALRSVADADPRLDRGALERLLDRARHQAGVLEDLRLAAAARAFEPSGTASRPTAQAAAGGRGRTGP
ncbi:hypothetical protein ACIRTB_13290 [Streptomyces sp. NPDC101158]|uniref:hypothetical protein n=1 Tax=Streptomyces sp. NPDC101158 TaxID=3366117 RepID=UPI0038280840